ncbi:MAG: prephenate dehydratase [Agathobacter sp.]|nr:prephenate dehydratase [Agathobacter sp.]
MEELLDLRKDIDEIDDEIVELYEKRMEIAQKVANYKIEAGKPVFDKEREISKLNTLSKKASNEFNKHGILELFEQIMAMSRKKQYQLIGEKGLNEKNEFEELEQFDFKDARIVFQGVEGAYSHQAMKKFFGEDCDSYNVKTWKDAMEAIRNKEADYAVLPIENSSAGIVSENYDLMIEYDNYIIAEQTIKIDHALLGVPGAEMKDIKTVYSHPQALMQCSDYLDEHKEWERISVKNTAMAAKKIRDEGRKDAAAIASAINADIYGVKVLEDVIQDNKNNYTRFIIVSGKKVYNKNAKSISLCFEIPHESGSLYHALSHFIYNNINMINIQSRPIQNKNWEYRFIIDIEGKFSDTSVQNALRGLREETASLRILGTY